MPGTETMAYVLSTKDYRDTSLLASFFTMEYGNIKAIIKGGRDAKYRYGSTLEPFSLNRITVYKRKRGDLHMVTAVELVDRFNALRTDLSKLGWASYLTELLNQLTDSEQHADVFHLMADALHFMSRHQGEAKVVVIFEVKLLKALGLTPALQHCIHCKQKEAVQWFFAVLSGGIVCENCKNKEESVRFISHEGVRFLQICMRSTIQEAWMAVIEDGDLSSAKQIMRQFCEHHLSYKPKSLDFLNKIGVLA